MTAGISGFNGSGTGSVFSKTGASAVSFGIGWGAWCSCAGIGSAAGGGVSFVGFGGSAGLGFGFGLAFLGFVFHRFHAANRATAGALVLVGSIVQV